MTSTPEYDRSKLTAPNCPHCGTPMALCGDAWENSMCKCWWNGANDGLYTHQVSRNLTDEELIISAVDPDAMRAWIIQRDDECAAIRTGQAFDVAMRQEKLAADFGAAPDASAKCEILFMFLYEFSEFRWTIKNKKGKGLRKMIRRFMDERWDGGSLEETVITIKEFRALSTTGRDPFAQ